MPATAECTTEEKEKLLPEDYITCLAEDESGALWIDTCRCGFVVANPTTWEYTLCNSKTCNLPDDYISSMMLSEQSKPIIAMYGGGAVKLKEEMVVKERERRVSLKIDYRVSNDQAVFPSTIKTPTAEDLKEIYYKIKTSETKKSSPRILALNDD